MIQYDPHQWRSHFFDIDGTMLRQISSRVLAFVMWSIVVVIVGRINDYRYAIPLHVHSLIGVALGLLLVFRTNASYDRFWEGRKLWGCIVNDSRNLGRLVNVFLKDDDAVRTQVLSWTLLFAWSVRHRLLGAKVIGGGPVELPADELQRIEQAEHIPVAIANRISEHLEAVRRKGTINDVQQTLLEATLSRLIDALGGCERISNTPMPFAYMVHLRRALILYLASVPLALVRDFGWGTVPAVLFISYVMLGIEEIGVEIEDPFGTDENDLPLDTICSRIEQNIRGLS